MQAQYQAPDPATVKAQQDRLKWWSDHQSLRSTVIFMDQWSIEIAAVVAIIGVVVLYRYMK